MVEIALYDLAEAMKEEGDPPMPAFRYQVNQGVGLMESALAQPRQTFQGRYLYRTIFDKVATLFFSLINNHPLQDGNKRTALVVALTFLMTNGYAFIEDQKATVRFTVRVASANDRPSLKEIASWFRKRSKHFRQIAAMPEEERSRIGGDWGRNFFITYVELITERLVETTRLLKRAKRLKRLTEQAEQEGMASGQPHPDSG